MGSEFGLHPATPLTDLPPGPLTNPSVMLPPFRSALLSTPHLALTFDDGPHGSLTPRLLDTLAQRQVKATFYVIGRNVEAHPEIARRIVEEGHEIANHTWSHPALSGLSASRVAEELRRTHQVVLETTGYRMTNLRPPYGAYTERVREVAFNGHGYDTIMWSVDPLDWKRPGAEVVRRRMVEGATPGGILLAHDIHPGTIDAMPGTIKDLKGKGYGFATVSQLLALQDHPSSPRTATPVAQEQQTVVR
jgi:peptidoglycan/xylan/chitin deacetylase (PgdA/CDA1 family)